MGTLFSGTLWIQYTAGGSSTTQQVASVKIPVSGTGVPSVPSASYYVPVTLNNIQSSGTGTNFQQQITIPASYSQYEAPDLGNIRFYEGGTELYSWCESSCSQGSPAVFWVNVSSGIAANSNTTLFAVFLANTVEYDGAYAGEAPQLTTPYAKYDNGVNVFSYYQNFKGGSCPSGWSCINSVSVNNGITVGTNSGMSVAISPLLTYIGTGGGVIDYYGSVSILSGSYDGSFMWAMQNGGTNPEQIVIGYPYLAGTYTVDFNLATGPGGAFSPQPSSGYHVWSFLTDLNANNYAQYDYSSTLSEPYGYAGSNTNPYTSIELISQGSSGQGKYYWVRTRAYPPGATMPSVAFGSVANS
jgi:hypothetical protein